MENLAASTHRNAVLIAAAIIVAPRLRELRDTPALRSAVNDAIRVAEYIARVVERRDGVPNGVRKSE